MGRHVFAAAYRPGQRGHVLPRTGRGGTACVQASTPQPFPDMADVSCDSWLIYGGCLYDRRQRLITSSSLGETMRPPTQRHAALSGVVGGFMWAVTPLRQPVFDAGRTPDEGELFFRIFNLVLVAIVILLTIALLRLRGSSPARLFKTGWWTILIGHVLLLVGSIPAVLLGDAARGLVKGGQDVGFLGAMVAGLGGFLVGVSGRRSRSIPKVALWLLLLTLPLGLLAISLLAAIGTPEDYLGLPLTVLYGGAWIVLGWSWIREETLPSASFSAASPDSQ